MRGSIVVIALVCCLSALNAYAISGIAVTNKCASSDLKGEGKGSIWKFIVKNGVADQGTQIYSSNDAASVRINQSGTKVAFSRNGEVCMIDIMGGPVTVLASAPSMCWIDFPEDEWVYFTKGGYWNRVSTDGAQKIESNVLRTPNGTSMSVARGGKRGAAHAWGTCGTNSVVAYGDVNFCRSGCGAGISVSGRYITHNLPTHADLNIYDLNSGGSLAHTIKLKSFSGSSENWNVNNFSANSDEWLCFKQGSGYLIEKSSRQVLYKVDGSQSFEVQPSVNGVFYEGGDFWVGAVGAVGTSGALTVRRSSAPAGPVLFAAGRQIVYQGVNGAQIRVWSLDGSLVNRTFAPAGRAGIAVAPGSYLVRVKNQGEVQTSTISVGN